MDELTDAEKVELQNYVQRWERKIERKATARIWLICRRMSEIEVFCHAIGGTIIVSHVEAA